jgi:hypothetical protein
MTKAPAHPPVHAYDPGKNPMELVDTPSGRMERWRADALLVGETSAATQARHDAVTTLDDIEAQKRELAAGQAALAIKRATFDAEKRIFADQAAALAGRLSVEWDRLTKLRTDQQEEPLVVPPGNPSDPNKEPEPPLALEGDTISGTLPGDPSESNGNGDPRGEFLHLKIPVTADQTEFQEGDLPHPPEVEQPIAAGLDHDQQEATRGD